MVCRKFTENYALQLIGSENRKTDKGWATKNKSAMSYTEKAAEMIVN
jgi:hypothetical protein